MSRRIRREGQLIFFSGAAEMIEHYPGLNPGDAARRIDLQNPRHVFGEIQDDGDVAALSCERGSSAAAKQRRSEFATERDDGQNIVHVARKHDANWHLAIIRAVGRVECAAAVVEAYVALN